MSKKLQEFYDGMPDGDCLIDGVEGYVLDGYPMQYFVFEDEENKNKGKEIAVELNNNWPEFYPGIPDGQCTFYDFPHMSSMACL